MSEKKIVQDKSEKIIELLLKVACKIRKGERMGDDLEIVSNFLYKGVVENMSDEDVLNVVLADLKRKVTPEKRKELLTAMRNFS
jgi:hypothetical protein